MTGQNGIQNRLKSSNQSIILFESSSNISQITPLLNENPIIISFDYDSHKLLSSHNIKHEISDSYLTRNDLRLIQKTSYKFTKWFDDKRISDILIYEGINLGLLIQVEFNYFLVQFIKKYFEISKIIDAHGSSHFFVSDSLYDLLIIFTDNVSIMQSAANSKNKFYYDNVKIPLKFGKKTFQMQISKNTFTKLQTLLDKVISLLFSPKKKIFDDSSASTLLVDFDTVRYENIFKNLPKSNLNLVLYNRRRPAIWNFKSYSIIKQSGSRIIGPSILLDKKLRAVIDGDQSTIKSMISLLFDHESFFEDFFSIKDRVVWRALKPIFQNLIEKRFYEFIMEIQLAKKILGKYKFSSILVWSEIGNTEQIMVKLAKKFGIHVVVLQHGLFLDSETEGAFDMNEFQGVFPRDADSYLVWGDIEKNHAVTAGLVPEKIVPLGSPIFDDLPDTTVYDGYVLLATTGPVQGNAFGLTIAEIEKNQQVIRTVAKVVNRLGKNLVVKIHPSPDEFDPTELVQSINPKFMVYKAGDISELILGCDIFVVIDVSTVMLNAQIMKKPVISIITKDEDYGSPSIIESKSCLSIDVGEFEDTLIRLLNDKDFVNSVINNGLRYSSNYVFNQGTSASKILDFLVDLK